MRYFPTVCPRKNICADEYTLRVRPRFYVPELDPSAANIQLPEEEAEHLSRVLRLGAGADVEIFDGRGGLWRAEVVQAGKHGVQVKAAERMAAAIESHVALTLVISVLKSDKMDDVIRDAVMLGVTGIQPVVSTRSEVSLATLARGHRVDRWQRIAVSSSKQCRRAVVPPVHQPLALEKYWQEPIKAQRLMCVEPAANVEGTTLADVAPPASAHVIVGPEGGWTVAEVAMAVEGGAILITLGARTLRADAVPIVALTALLTTWSDL